LEFITDAGDIIRDEDSGYDAASVVVYDRSSSDFSDVSAWILHHLFREGQLFDKHVVDHFSQVMKTPESDYGKVSSLGLYLNANSRNIRVSYPSKETSIVEWLNQHSSFNKAKTCFLVVMRLPYEPAAAVLGFNLISSQKQPEPRRDSDSEKQLSLKHQISSEIKSETKPFKKSKQDQQRSTTPAFRDPQIVNLVTPSPGKIPKPISIAQICDSISKGSWRVYTWNPNSNRPDKSLDSIIVFKSVTEILVDYYRFTADCKIEWISASIATPDPSRPTSTRSSGRLNSALFSSEEAEMRFLVPLIPKNKACNHPEVSHDTDLTLFTDKIVLIQGIAKKMWIEFMDCCKEKQEWHDLKVKSLYLY
jgi:hypothetical protein